MPIDLKLNGGNPINLSSCMHKAKKLAATCTQHETAGNLCDAQTPGPRLIEFKIILKSEFQKISILSRKLEINMMR